MTPRYDIGHIVTLEAAILDYEEGTAIVVTDGHYLQREKEVRE